MIKKKIRVPLSFFGFGRALQSWLPWILLPSWWCYNQARCRVEARGQGCHGAGRMAQPGSLQDSAHTELSVCVCVCVCVCAQSRLTLCDLMDYSTSVSSVHGILQGSTLEGVAIPFSRASSWSRDWTRVSCIAGRFFTIWATREAHTSIWGCAKCRF